VTRWGKFEIGGGLLGCGVDVGLVMIGFEVAEEEEATGID
jgi:hypothetical protein